MLILALAVPEILNAQDFIPMPQKVVKKEGTFTINSETKIVNTEYAFLATYLNEHIQNAAGIKLTESSQVPPSNYIILHSNETLPEEGYTIDIDSKSIYIQGKNRKGIFYALQTLFQMMPSEVYSKSGVKSTANITLPAIHIEDYPRYKFRAVMLDVSRTFFDKQQVMQYIDWAARHKINKFHWHLTDDNGWRIEIKKYPELTEKGAWRGPGEVLPTAYGSGQKRYGGFYTQEDIREIVRYAMVRNIEIIPEIDLPGHSLALTSVYPETFCETSLVSEQDDGVARNVLCVGREENFDMLKDILTEIAELFPSKYINIGGDEVNYAYWKTCPRCMALMKAKGYKSVYNLHNYFIKRLESIIHSLCKEAIVWNDATRGGTVHKTTAILGWKDLQACEKSLKSGYSTILMPASYTYMDMKHSPYDRGHYWAGMVDTRRIYSLDQSLLNITPAEAKHILGVEAGLWAELLDRPERFMEYQAYPKICAFSEVAWSNPAAKNWDDFYHRLTGSHLDRLAAMGVQFRMFPAEVTYNNGRITATSDVPGAEIRYTTDHSEPNINSMVYTAPIADHNPERYRFRTFYKTGYSAAVPPSAKMETTFKPAERRTINIPLKEYIDKPGIWFLSVSPHETGVMINRLEITGGETPYIIIRNGQRANPLSNLRLYITDKNIDGTLSITLTNNSKLDNPVIIGFRPSPYIEPKVTISSSMAIAQRFPIRNIADYNLTSYVRTTEQCEKGDYLRYNFAEPVECYSIDIRTGTPNVTRYTVTNGYVEYSTDGMTFSHKTALNENGAAIIYPEEPVKSVRIMINDRNGEHIVAFQDLRIIPKY